VHFLSYGKRDCCQSFTLSVKCSFNSLFLQKDLRPARFTSFCFTVFFYIYKNIRAILLYCFSWSRICYTLRFWHETSICTMVFRTLKKLFVGTSICLPEFIFRKSWLLHSFFLLQILCLELRFIWWVQYWLAEFFYSSNEFFGWFLFWCKFSLFLTGGWIDSNFNFPFIILEKNKGMMNYTRAENRISRLLRTRSQCERQIMSNNC
jgi:hypothetical protein